MGETNAALRLKIPYKKINKLPTFPKFHSEKNVAITEILRRFHHEGYMVVPLHQFTIFFRAAYFLEIVLTERFIEIVWMSCS